MNDLEARLRRTLSEGLDRVGADAGRGPATIRRARRGRALRGIAAGLAGVLVVAAAATAWERDDGDRRPPPAAEPETAATFGVSFGGRARGTVTVDVPKAQVCFDLPHPATRFGGQLQYDPDGPGDPIVAVFATTTRRSGPQCRPVDPSDAERLVAEPRLHYVSLPQGEAAALEPLRLEPEYVPDLAEIVCSQDGAVVLTPQVQPRLDGVHYAIYNQERAWDEFVVTRPGAGGGWGGGFPPSDVYSGKGNIAPGAHLIGCFRDTRRVPYGDPTHPDYATFTVLDPYDMWNDPELDCVEGDQRPKIVTDDPVGSRMRPPDYDALIREFVPGVRPSDVLERPTYPESASKGEPGTLIRDGRKIASFAFATGRTSPRSAYQWAIWPRVCPGSGIAPP